MQCQPFVTRSFRRALLGNAQRLGYQGCALLSVLLFLLVAVRAQDVQTLSPDKAIEREISGGQTHTYAIALKAGQFVHFEVQQTSCDVALTLIVPDGKRREINATQYGKRPATKISEIQRTNVP